MNQHLSPGDGLTRVPGNIPVLLLIVIGLLVVSPVHLMAQEQGPDTEQCGTCRPDPMSPTGASQFCKFGPNQTAPVPCSLEQPPPPPADVVDPSLETLMQTATSDADLAARLSAIGELGSHAQHDARVMESLADLADHDHNPQVRDAASMLLDGGR